MPPVVGFGVKNESLRTEDHEVVASHWVPMMIVGTALWGVGQGVYLAGDQALGYALLPNADEASRFLGFTAITSALGAGLGSLVAGGLLQFFGRSDLGGDSDGPGYSYQGYVAMFLFAVSLGLAMCSTLQSISLTSKFSERMPFCT